MSIPWSDIRGAVRAWVVTGAAPDVAADHVIWSGQQHDIPSGMYITIGIIGELDADPTGDLVSYTDNVDGSVDEHRTSWRTVRLGVTCYGGVTQVDATLPARVLSRVRSAARFQVVANALNAANVGIMSIDQITTLGRSTNTVAFEPRAMMNVDVCVVGVVSDVSGGAGVIEVVGPITQEDPDAT